jgi:hypothetical protein
MADIFWDRIEPHSRDPQVEGGLAAAIADPLWMLARQWQVGEFRGEDAASPIDMQVRVAHVPLVSFRNEAGRTVEDRAEPLPLGQPLESRVEAQAVPSSQARFSLSAMAGLDLLRRLDAAGLRELRSVFRAHTRLQVDQALVEALPAADRARIRLLLRGALDGFRLLQESERAIGDMVPEPLRERALTVWGQWREAQGRRFDQPGPSGETWVDTRLEHRFSIATAAPDHTVVLRAEQYVGGRLDWYSFDLDMAAPAHKVEVPPRMARLVRRDLDTLAVPLTYAGMPASRYWQFEEGTVYFGGIEAGPADLGRLLVAEFATVYSDDWFLVPVRFPIGCLARVERISVRNTFGERHTVRSCAEWDEERPGGRAFAFFELSGDLSAANDAAPWLPLVPSLSSTLHGGPLEAVSFVRDEAANLAWAIEGRIETVGGRSLSRRLTAKHAARRDARARTERTSTGAGDEDAPWRYRLQTPVPPYWIPLVPERPDPRSAAVVLRRARMLAGGELEDPQEVGAKGTLLTPARPFVLHEEEIPRGGVQVTRQWQVARGADGSLHLWMARRKRPGRGERGSGLQYDTMLRT